ncbi:MAG: tetratricopeptide repeat protein [Terriglobales bacterium]|jgi:Tfp pilus assembly protein PilF
MSTSSPKGSRRSAKAPVRSSSSSPRIESFPLDRQILLLCLALAAAVFVAYSPVIHNSFVHYDDHLYITENAQVKTGLTWATAVWALTNYYEANWHPLTWMSHALDCDLFGLNPVGPHLENVLLHAANAILLFLVLQKATGFRWRSLMVAALFALHPLNVESVAWAAERKNVLSMLFFLLAFYGYGWYLRRPGLGRYTAMASLYALALMAKPQVITFPLLLLLCDYWPLGRIGLPHDSGSVRVSAFSKLWSGPLLREKLPLLMLSAASALLTMGAQKDAGAIKTFDRYSTPLRIETALVAYVRYLGKAFWPSKLVALYPHPTRLYPAWQVSAALALLLAITVLVLRAPKQRYLAAGWLWFLGSLVPMIGLIQVGEQAMADRYAYIPFIGLFVMVVWLIADWAAARRISPRWLAIPAIACLIALATLTYRQIGYWHDTESFWRRTIALSNDNYVAHGELAGLLHEQGKTEEAIEQIRTVLAIHPSDVPANFVIGDYEKDHGNYPAAIERFQAAARNSPSPAARARAYSSLGLVYNKMGQPQMAKQSFEMSLQYLPVQANVMVLLGVIAENAGDLAGAVDQYSRAVKVQATDVGILLLAHALQQEGKTGEANSVYERAVRLSPNLARAQQQAAALLAGK